MSSHVTRRIQDNIATTHTHTHTHTHTPAFFFCGRPCVPLKRVGCLWTRRRHSQIDYRRDRIPSSAKW